MEETKWLTKSKIIIIASILVVIIGIIVGIFIHRSNLKKDYIEFQNQLEYAAPNYLLKEKIKLYEYEWREINIKDILKQKLVANERASDCEGYVIAEALKDSSIDLEKSTSNTKESANESETSDNNSSSDNEEKNNVTDDTSKETDKAEEKNISSNITYKAYVKCKKIYTTEGYGTKPSDKNKNDDETQSENDTEKPVIKLFGDETVTLTVGDKYDDPGAVATDNIDGDITKKIKISGKVNTKKAGEYIVKYTVKDTAGNKASVERKVIVEQKKDEKEEEPKKDTIAPIITFNDNSLYQTICTGTSVNISLSGPYGYVARDDVDGEITSNVKITGDTGVIYNVGTYNLHYTVTDSSGNKAEATKQFSVSSCSSANNGSSSNQGTTPSTPTTPTTPETKKEDNPTLPKRDTTVSVTSIVLTPNSTTLSKGQTLQLSVSVIPSNATNKTVTYSSSNSSVASVSSSGVVNALSSGSATITATSSNGRTAICNITVK